MGSRHEAREWAVQLLFQLDFNPEELDDALEEFWKDKEPSAKMKAFTEDLVRGVSARRPEIDKALQLYAEHWDVQRMGGVDRSVMRLALYEMMFCPDIPPVVSINEAVEIAKDFSSYESGRFVNGILDRALKEVGRPAREPARKKKGPSDG